MNRLLKCDGYEMFHGSFLVTPVFGREPFRKSGDWLHIPHRENMGYDIWYCQPDSGFSQSYPAKILSDMRLEDD